MKKRKPSRRRKPADPLVREIVKDTMDSPDTKNIMLEYHLQHNFYPPIDRRFAAAALQAIVDCANGDHGRVITLPNNRAMVASAIVEELHLEQMVESERQSVEETWDAIAEEEDEPGLKGNPPADEARIDRLDEATAGAYMYDDYPRSTWRTGIKYLASLGWSDEAIIEALRSKYPRWISDSFNGRIERLSGRAFAKALEHNLANIRQMLKVDLGIDPEETAEKDIAQGIVESFGEHEDCAKCGRRIPKGFGICAQCSRETGVTPEDLLEVVRRGAGDPHAFVERTIPLSSIRPIKHMGKVRRLNPAELRPGAEIMVLSDLSSRLGRKGVFLEMVGEKAKVRYHDNGEVAVVPMRLLGFVSTLSRGDFRIKHVQGDVRSARRALEVAHMMPPSPHHGMLNPPGSTRIEVWGLPAHPTREEQKAWVLKQFAMGLNFHPDTAGKDYVYDIDKPTFSRYQAQQYDLMLKRYFAGKGDPYEVSLEAWHEFTASDDLRLAGEKARLEEYKRTHPGSPPEENPPNDSQGKGSWIDREEP